MFHDGYITLDGLSTRLNLPGSYLRNLAEGNRIPFLLVKGRMRFHEDQVREALGNLARNTHASNTKDSSEHAHADRRAGHEI